eukprot:TRINITY_DN33761_c0_g1_i1.p1 TRINITY_DN33761_c0_g1~~TRINITY_DN33761_c0_g1_i1.p1  ORF type:complete len:389 (+),score=76.13 TRINITY_DN33761_c0_g1_i1:92-1258(+)
MTSARRPPPDLRRGSWFAQQGAAGLRFGGLQGSGPAPGGRGRGLSSSVPPEVAGRSVKGPAAAPASTGASSRSAQGVDISDALDDLLSHARITLKQLDALRAQQAASTSQAPRGQGKADRQSAAKAANTRDPRKRPNFWKPTCNPRLWSGGSPATDDGLSQPCSDDEDSESSVDSDSGDLNWDFLHRGGVAGAAAAGPRQSPAAQAASAAAAAHFQLPRRGGSVPPPTAGTPTPPSTGFLPHQKVSRDKGSRPGKTGQATAGASSTGGNSGNGYGTGSEPLPDPSSARRGHSQGPQRGHTAGFRFGASASNGLTPRATSGPEAEVTATLQAAIAGGGQDAGRQALKRLLLRWHPDKVLQGDSAEAKAAQEEATRVLRFVLQERERFGL